jgi:heme/copper-type cytochrome/quinol oxidase subunit 3
MSATAMPDKTLPGKTIAGTTMPDKTKLGVGLFLLSEANFFLILLVAYVYFHSLPSDGPTAANSLNPMRTLAFSICLFLSSATIHLAGRSFRLGEIKPSGFEAVSMYWHFVDAVWVVIFAVVYLWPLVG